MGQFQSDSYDTMQSNNIQVKPYFHSFTVLFNLSSIVIFRHVPCVKSCSCANTATATVSAFICEPPQLSHMLCTIFSIGGRPFTSTKAMAVSSKLL